MAKQDKDLLLRDLSARLLYGFIVHRYSNNVDIKINTIDDFSHFLEYSNDEIFKPYLRPMSSMTEEELLEYISLKESIVAIDDTTYFFETYESIDWLNAHHFDYRGLIEKGLALKAPKEMYNLNDVKSPQ